MRFIKDDGGRADAGFVAEKRSDCVVRAIAIATGLPYAKVRRDLIDATLEHAATRNTRVARHLQKYGDTDPDGSVYRAVWKPYIESLGWKWTPTMTIGGGCRVHLRALELPRGRLIVQVTKHLVAVIDRTIHDMGDPARGGTRCVYGYYTGDRLWPQSDDSGGGSASASDGTIPSTRPGRPQ